MDLQGDSKALAGTRRADEAPDRADDSPLTTDDSPHIFRSHRELVGHGGALNSLGNLDLIRSLSEQASGILDELFHGLAGDGSTQVGRPIPAFRKRRATVSEGWAP